MGSEDPGRRRHYIDTLLRLERFRSAREFASPVLGFLGEGALLGRVRSLADTRPARSSPPSRLPALGIAAGTALLAALLVVASLPAVGLSSWALMEEDIARRERAAQADASAATAHDAHTRMDAIRQAVAANP